MLKQKQVNRGHGPSYLRRESKPNTGRHGELRKSRNNCRNFRRKGQTTIKEHEEPKRKSPGRCLQRFVPKTDKAPRILWSPKNQKEGSTPTSSSSIRRATYNYLDSLGADLTSTAALRSIAHPKFSNSKSSLERTFPKRKVPPNTIIVTMDVVSLYPSIPIDDGIGAVMDKLKKHASEVNTLGLPLRDIESLLHFVLMNNFLKFGEATY